VIVRSKSEEILERGERLLEGGRRIQELVDLQKYIRMRRLQLRRENRR